MDTPSLSAMLEDEPELLTLPELVSELLALLDAPDARMGPIVALTSSDAALTAKVLRLINSPYYALPVKVESVSRAISLIGRQNLRDLVIATKVAERFRELPGSLVTVRRFWQHNLFAASVARDIGHALGLNGDNLFTVALLHHLGAMVMLQKLPLQMESILRSSRGDISGLFAAEQDEFGFTHAEVGARLLQSWGMPSTFVEVARFHHSFHLAPNYATEAAIVHLADVVAQRSCPLVQYEGPVTLEPNPQVFRYVTLTPERLDGLCQAVRSRGNDAAAVLSEP